MLQTVRGTGPDGRVTAKDVEAFTPSAAAAARPVAAAARPSAAAAMTGVEYVDIPLSNIRQVLYIYYVIY